MTAAQVADLTAGRYYVNLHTAKNPGGEIRGQLTRSNRAVCKPRWADQLQPTAFPISSTTFFASPNTIIVFGI